MRYIDADKLKSDIKEIAKITGGNLTEFEALGVLSGQPTADVRENVRGKWIKGGMSSLYKCQCSECGCYHRAMYDFCPSCGADMRGEQHE